MEGGGIKEDKRYINSKSPWTLAHLNMKVLKGFYNNPAVPPSMKKKLKEAMMMKPTLKGGMCGRRRTTAVAPSSIQADIAELIRQWRADYSMGNDIPINVLLRIANVAIRSRNGEESIRLLNRYPEIVNIFARYPLFRDDIYSFFRSNTANDSIEDPEDRTSTRDSNDTEDPDNTGVGLTGVGLTGGLTGVSKASGFIRRLMWENKHKHKGQYKKPTWELASDSKMNKPFEFKWKELASKDQGGLNENDYGSSPFITKYFKEGAVKFEKGNTAKETKAQKKARAKFSGRPEPKEKTIELKNEIPQMDMGQPPEGITVTRKKTVEDIKEIPRVLGSYVYRRNKWGITRSYPQFDKEWREEFDVMGDKEKALVNFALNNPKGKLAEAIQHLKAEGFTKGLANGTVSPLLKNAKAFAEKGIE
jgi:hypothetical protein